MYNLMKLHIAMYSIGVFLIVFTAILSLFFANENVETDVEEGDFVPVGLAEAYILKTDSPGRLDLYVSKVYKTGESSICAEIWRENDLIKSYYGKSEPYEPLFNINDEYNNRYKIDVSCWLEEGGEYTVRLYGLRSKDSYWMTYEPILSIYADSYFSIWMPASLILLGLAVSAGGLFNFRWMLDNGHLTFVERPGEKERWRTMLLGIVNVAGGIFQLPLMVGIEILLIIIALFLGGLFTPGLVDTMALVLFFFIILPLIVLAASLSQITGGVQFIRGKGEKSKLVMTSAGVFRNLMFCIIFMGLGIALLLNGNSTWSLLGWVPALIFGLFILAMISLILLVYRIGFNVDPKEGDQ